MCCWPRGRSRAGAMARRSSAARVAKANEQGHRTIAAQLRRPPGTVRGWLRTLARRAEPVASSARGWTHALDASADHAIAPGSPIVDAVDALGIAARACRRRLGLSASPWELAVALTGLLYGDRFDARTHHLSSRIGVGARKRLRGTAPRRVAFWRYSSLTGTTPSELPRSP